MKSENNVHEYGKVLNVLKVDGNGTQTVEMEFACDRCNGEGKINYYKHVEAGICFKCGGSKVMTKKVKIYTDEQWLKLEAQREKRRQKALAEQAIKQAEIDRIEAEKEAERQKVKDGFKVLNRDFYRTLKGYMEHVSMDRWTADFMKSILELRLTKDIRDISDRQKEILCDIVGKTAGRRNSKAYNAAYDEIAEKLYVFEEC